MPTAPHPSLLVRDAYVTDGWLSRRAHPQNSDLVIYNYTQRATYAAQWDETTMESRGASFVRSTGQRVSRPFRKFFNLGEVDATRMEALPLDAPYVCHEKVDGWLGVGYRGAAHGVDADPNGWSMSTRGSFESTGALWATRALGQYRTEAIPPGVTPCFELVSPDTKIVVDYGGREALVLLAVFDVATGAEWSMDDVDALARATGFDRPAVYAYGLDEALRRAKAESWQCEGWVLHWPGSGLRVKVKTDAYKLVAKAAQAMGPLWAWDAVLAGAADAAVDALPEVLRPEAHGLVTRVQSGLARLESEVEAADRGLGVESIDPKDKAAAKSMALAIQAASASQVVTAALFARMRRRPPAAVREILLKSIRPDGNAWRGGEGGDIE